MSGEEILDEVARLSPGGGLVEITGGEPMLQEKEVVPLMEQLLERGYKVLLETSGERALARVTAAVIKIVDVKCPNSGEADTFAMENLGALQAHDEVKFVLSDRTDYEFGRDFVEQHRLVQRVHAVLFSPAFRKGASGARDSSIACSIRRNSLNGYWRMTFRPGLAFRIHKLDLGPGSERRIACQLS
jgi:7-carboxy-7-deazaguanine synthase